jgi:hypothetical protein
MFEADKGLKASVHSTVEKTTCGKFEFTQVRIDPKCKGQEHHSRVTDQVSYWHRDPATSVGKYITGQVAEDLKNVPDIERSSMCALKHEAIAANPQVRAKLAEVNNNARRKFKDVCTYTGRRRLVQAKMDKVKAENVAKRENYVKGRNNDSATSET